MELVHFRTVIEGLDSLAEIEKEHPVLGAELLSFVIKVSNCCEIAYQRLSEALGEIRSLPTKPTSTQIENVLKKINAAPNSKWFKEVSGICDQLAALNKKYEPAITRQRDYVKKDLDTPRYETYYKIDSLLSLLQKHEGELKDDMRKIIAVIQSKLGPAQDSRNVKDARAYALKVQEEISQDINEIKTLRHQIEASSSKGVSAVLKAEVAENALRRPERVLILNMFFVFVVTALGATAFQFLRVHQFILVTGFAMTAVIVINALYLRTIDKLSEESFLKLMQLALLKFFAPLTRGRGKNK